MPSRVRVSLVICTRNRAYQLRETLQRIQDLAPPFSWELIVVNNGSDDDTHEIVRTFAESLKLTEIIETRRGVSAGRNTGWRASTGELIAFIDDDCYPTPDYLESVVRCFDESPDAGFVGGRVLLYSDGDARVGVQERNVKMDFRPFEFIAAGTIHGANCAFRRATLHATNGFDERLGPGALIPAGEDVDILARTLALGWCGVYDPRVVVFHHHGRRDPAIVESLKRDYDRGRGAYYIKCLLNPILTRQYMKQWYWAIRRQPYSVTRREVGAAFRLAMHLLVAIIFQVS